MGTAYDAPDDKNCEVGKAVAWGWYSITIEVPSRNYAKNFDLDLRDANWIRGNEAYRDTEIWYHTSEPHLTYKSRDGIIHGNVGDSSTVWGWYGLNQNKPDLLVPVTANNNFSSGKIKMASSEYDTPHTCNWGWTTTHTIEAVTPQHDIDGRVYTFSQWSDGNQNTSRQVTPDDQHSSYSFQANFTSKPETPKNFSGTTENNHPKLTWTPNTGSSILGYWIYRNFNKQGFEHCATVTPKTASQWIDNFITTSEPNYVVAYRMDCYDNNGQHSDPTGSVYYWGDIELKKARSLSSSSSTPAHSALFPNHPNPFNPETTIQYQLAEGSRVSMSVYNVLGAEVQRLVDENQPAGVYSIRWDGRDTYGKQVAGGIYIYKIEAVGSSGRFVQTKKMILMK